MAFHVGVQAAANLIQGGHGRLDRAGHHSLLQCCITQWAAQQVQRSLQVILGLHMHLIVQHTRQQLSFNNTKKHRGGLRSPQTCDAVMAASFRCEHVSQGLTRLRI